MLLLLLVVVVLVLLLVVESNRIPVDAVKAKPALPYSCNARVVAPMKTQQKSDKGQGMNMNFSVLIQDEEWRKPRLVKGRLG